MRTFPRILSVLLLVFGLLTPRARAEDRPADKILADINAVEQPKLPEDRTDRVALQDYNIKSRKAAERRAALIGELYRADPERAELANLLPRRWAVLRGSGPAAAITIDSETAEVLAMSKDENLLGEATFHKLLSTFRSIGPKAKAEDLIPLVDDFARKYPSHARIPTLLLMVAGQISDPDEKEVIFKRFEKEYPNNPNLRNVARSRARIESDRAARARVGKPFELEFTEATKGTPITMASLKGKVVVVDFWATWCGPCVAEMPRMKKLYAEYKDKGVEFIGVSLDEPKELGGLDKLKEYVAKNEIDWPQYYQGNGWQSEFSSSWSVHSIPCVFLVDAEGNLASIEAQGKLETLVPEYLEKARAGANKTASAP